MQFLYFMFPSFQEVMANFEKAMDTLDVIRDSMEEFNHGSLTLESFASENIDAMAGVVEEMKGKFLDSVR